jgi:RHS repeat-associated protein
MRLKKLQNKIAPGVMVILLLLSATFVKGQSCFSFSQSACCNTFNFTLNTNITYVGNNAVVQMTPVITPTGNPCQRISNFTFDYGDGSPIAGPFALNDGIVHTYTLSPGCASTSYTIQICMTDPTIATGATHCVRSYVITIPNFSSLASITAINTSCKTFSFTYNGPSPVTNASWAFGDATFSSPNTTVNPGGSIVHTYPASGSYVVNLYGDQVGACPVYTWVTVNDIESPDFTYTVNNICDPTAGVILSVPNYTNTNTYSWQINNLIVPFLGSSATYTNNLVAGQNIIKLLISNGSGCSTSVTKYVTIGTPNPNFTAFTQSVCVGDMFSPIGVQSGGDSYTWAIQKPDNTFDTPLTGMNPYYIFNNAGTYSITLTISNTYTINNVVTTCTNVSSPLTVTASAIPNATFTIPPQLCAGAVSLTIPNSTYLTYTLNYGDGTIFNGTGSIPAGQTVHTYTANGIFNISLLLNNNGCNDAYNQNTVINGLASLSVFAPNSYLCSGSSGSLTAVLYSVPLNAGTITYTWTGPNTFTSNASSVIVPIGGVYQVSVTSNGTCPINLTAIKTLTDLAAPTATLISVGTLNCTSPTTTAVIEISTALQQQGYCINGNCTPANLLANSPLQITVPNIVNGTNFINIKNGIDQSCSSNLMVTATQNNPVITLNVTQPTNCNTGASGSANISFVPNIGTATWYLVSGYPGSPLGTGNSISNLLPGNYVVEVVNGLCSSQSYFNIALPVINITKSGAAGTCSTNATPITINPQFVPGSVTGTFTYNWYQVAGNTGTLVASGGSNTQNLVAGNYSVDVTASNGCTASYSFGIISYDPITIQLNTTLPTCKVPGDITAIVSGGDGNYNFGWYLNGVLNGNTTSVLSLATLTAVTNISVAVNDQSGCAATAPATPITITPPSLVTLLNCGGVGNTNATNITGCDISACVQGGAAPYTFEWYKLVSKNTVVEWQFYYNNTNTFIATNGSQTLTVPVPTSSANLTSLLANNTDFSVTTVCYPYWDFTNSPAVPILNGLAQSLSITPTSTNTAHYYTVIETITTPNVEDFVASYSGNSGQTYDNGNFTTGTYNLHVIDANGCKYTFNIGNLNFTEPTTFNVSFTYVWGIDPVQVAPVESEIVLQEDFIEAAGSLLDEASKCMQQKLKGLNSFLDGNCDDLSQFKDALNLTYDVTEHHYTLYYYDRAGQLTKTVPPEGVDYLVQADINQVKASRTSTVAATWPGPNHRMPTKYQYNSFAQLLQQQTPDGGETKFIYDSKNRLRFSQNEKQKTAGTPVYSYTKYDELGRIIEVGESSLTTGLNFANPTSTTNLAATDNTVFPAVQNKQITRTVYSDLSAMTYYGKPQRFLQNRVSYTYIDEDPSVTGDEHYTYFSYDSHGNVEWLVKNDPKGIGRTYIAYDYDLISGNVLQVKYNEMRLDRFYHRYIYDSENRLVKTQTSRDGELWDEDASYAYYPHGPLKRNVIGEDHVQGMDYIYTLQGWIKSVNSPSLTALQDPGADNGAALPMSGNAQDKVAADRHGMILNYYNGDYKKTGSFLNASPLYALASYSAGDAPSLFNGNISSWVQSQLNTVTTDPIDPRADLYKYDLLNRIKQNISLKPSTTSTSGWENISNTNSDTYKTEYSYDANGNILTLNRYDNNGIKMDELAYTYDNGAMNEALNANRLSSVQDLDASFLNGRGDLEATHQYSYDAIGNLVNEVAQERLNPTGSGYQLYTVNTNIDWTVYGKIKEVRKTIDPSGLNLKERITFAYDATGNRVKKEYWKDAGATPNGLEEPNEITTTFYSRDAQGNTMATYQKYFDAGPGLYKYDLIERPIYGSDRIGQSIQKVNLTSSSTFSSLPIPPSGITALSEYQNWITATGKSQAMSGVANNLCQCRIVSLTSNTTNPNPNYDVAQNAVDFLGIANNGIALAEDLDGNLQFYVVLAKKYLGNADACLIFDKDNNLMKGTELVGGVNINSKPVIVNIPNSSKYAVVTLGSNNQPTYHIVNVSLPGYGMVNPAGEVITVNQALSAISSTATTYGYHFTGLEDHVNGKGIVYASRYTVDPIINTQGTTEILAYDFGTGTVTPQENSLYSINGCGNTETGELQISPQGDKLAWYQHDKTLSGFKTRSGYIYTMPLSTYKTALNGTVDIKPISNAGNYGNGMLEFMSDNEKILYSQRGIYKEGGFDRNVWKYDPVTLGTTAINPYTPYLSYLFSEIKRGVDGKYYIPNMGDPADRIHSYTGAAWNGSVNVTLAAYELASSLPTQVYKIFPDPSQLLKECPRTIGEKEYELKDHLGNVKVVLSDIKFINDANTSNTIDNADQFTPEVKSYTDYYAFGMVMPGRQFNSGSYRYGYNGKENDNEVKGTGVQQNYGMRIYDTRIAKFLSIDPLIKDYPELTPYQYASNNPIANIDIDGLEGGSTTNPYATYGIVTRTKPKPEGRWGVVACDYCELDVLRNNPNKLNTGTMGKVEWSATTWRAGSSYPGTLIYIRSYPVITNNPPVVNITPVGIAAQVVQPAVNTSFNLNRGQTSGLTPAQTAVIAASVPPQGPQPPVATGPPVPLPRLVNTVLNSEELPQTTINNQFNQAANQINNNTRVTITILTANPAAGTMLSSGITAQTLNDQRAVLITNQLIAQGVPAANITVNPHQYGQTNPDGTPLTNGNQINITSQNTQNTTPVNVNVQQNTVIDNTYGDD